MTECKTKRWSLSSTDLQTLADEMEGFLNSGGEVKTFQIFIFNGQLILIAIFGNA